MERDARAVYVISVAAELAGVHPQTLRIYERRGLLRPARTSGGNRRYSEADIHRLRRIAELTDAGVGLEGIKRIMELEAEVARLHAELEAERERVRALTNGEPRYTLVPLRQAITLFGRRPSIFEDDR